MFGDQSHRIASGVANAHGAARATTDNVGHALLVVLVALLSLIALLFVLARLEPRKDARGVAHGRWASPAPEPSRRGHSTSTASAQKSTQRSERAISGRREHGI